MTGKPEEYKELEKYFISRSDKDFWKYYDWFQSHEYENDPVNAGLLDLNRYARMPWNKEE